MELIITLIIIIISLIILHYVFNINIKKIKQIGESERLNNIANKFPENKEICEEILKILKNEKVKIKENEDKNNKTSLYVTVFDTIFIANIKDTYTRIQTIAHECLHSVQNKKKLMFNFIFSNIYIIYFVLSITLSIFGVFKNYGLQIIILILLSFIYFTVRSYLENDAMINAKYLAKEYMINYIEKNNVCTKEEVEEVINEYDKINKIGIPTYNYILFLNCYTKVGIYTIITLILNLIKG